MPRCLIIDTLYSDFLRTLPEPTGTYEAELRRVLDQGFGTFDAYSFYLSQQGFICADVIANHASLQGLWASQYRGWENASLKAIALEQIHDFKPDVVFCQDLGWFSPAELSYLRSKYLLAGQISCALPAKENVSKFHVLMTSFPFYVDRLKALGVPVAEYLPLAFDPRMMPEVWPERVFDISFVGGVGKQSHWKAGTETLERVAEVFKERFIWFGYGVENLEKGSPLRPRYGGAAFGRDMYDVYARSKIVINRHGEIAAGFTNNLRCFEAMGMCACLLTESSPNLDDLFHGAAWAYSSTESLINNINKWLADENMREVHASRGQNEIMKNHTYAHRMKVVSEVLTKALDRVTA